MINLSKNDQAEALALLDHIFLQKSDDSLDDDLLAAKLRKRWRKKWTKQIEYMIDALEDMPPETHAGILYEMQEAMAQALGKDFGQDEGVKKIVKQHIRRAYAMGKSLWANQNTITHTNTGITIDQRAINFVNDNGCFWLGEFYSNKIQPEVQQAVTEALIWGVDSKTLSKTLKEKLGDVFGNTAYQYWDVAASSMLVRAKAFGNVFGMEEAQITEYEVFAMMDEGTCRICREMDGRRFSVKDAADTCRSVMEMTDPEEVKQALPWMSTPPIGVSSKALSSQGRMMPPFHGRCRCDIVMHEVKTEKTNKVVKKEIMNLCPKDKRSKTEILSIDQDTRTALFKEGSYLPKKGLANWKYDLLDRQKQGIIKERRIYDNLGRIDTEIHLNNHGTSKYHDKPHVHRYEYESTEQDSQSDFQPVTVSDGSSENNDFSIDDDKIKNKRINVEQSLVSWEKEVVENMPQKMLDKDSDWIWKSIKTLLWKAKKLLENL